LLANGKEKASENRQYNSRPVEADSRGTISRKNI
jgi:hypothetical protein